MKFRERVYTLDGCVITCWDQRGDGRYFMFTINMYSNEAAQIVFDDLANILHLAPIKNNKGN